MLSTLQCHHHLNLAKSKTVKMSLSVKWGVTKLQGDGTGEGDKDNSFGPLDIHQPKGLAENAADLCNSNNSIPKWCDGY